MRTKEMRKGENSTEEKRRKQQKTVVVYDTLRHRKRIKNMTIIEFIEKMAMIKKRGRLTNRKNKTPSRSDSNREIRRARGVKN